MGSQQGMAGYLARHLQTALASLGRLSRQPATSLMTVIVIAIALALPAGLYLLVDNLRNLGGYWEGSSITLSLFLQQEAGEQQARELLRRIDALPQVEQAELIGKAQALEEFRRYSGLADALHLLDENPLPMTILIKPAGEMSDASSIGKLAEELAKEGLVEQVLIDLEWVKRFAAMTRIAQRGVAILAVMLGLAVLMIIGNTIRLEIRNRQDEIIIIKQVGGSDAFVRRPFLYSGFWYGLFGAFGAFLLVLTAGGLLQGPVTRLSSLYLSEFSLNIIDFQVLAMLLLGGPALGLLGAWSATGRHLSAIEPV